MQAVLNGNHLSIFYFGNMVGDKRYAPKCHECRERCTIFAIALFEKIGCRKIFCSEGCVGIYDAMKRLAQENRQ